MHCTQCGESNSADAKFCSKCGKPIGSASSKKPEKKTWAEMDSNERATGIGCGIAIILGLIFMLSMCGESDEERAASAAEEAANREKGFHCLSAWDGSHREVVDLAKQRLRDPSSFEHYETKITPANDAGKHTLVMEYGARNGFGGMNRESLMAEVDQRSCKATLVGDL